MAKTPTRNTPLAIPLSVDRLVEGIVQVDPSQLAKKGTTVSTPKPGDETRKVVTKKTGAKNRRKGK